MHYARAADNPLASRDDVAQLVRDLVAPLLPCVTPAGIDLGTPVASYGEPVASMESLLRPLWGLAPLAAGGGVFAHWAVWRDAIVAGTDPAHPAFWGWPGNAEQRIVEAAALAHALAIARPQLWDPLPPAQRAQVAAWLRCVHGVEIPDNNWQWFPVLVNLGLRACGEAVAADADDAHLARIDAFHQGGGWYADGAAAGSDAHLRIGDYYTPMAMQFYALLYAAAGDKAGARETMYRERATQFAHDFVHWFAADGPAVPFGRSLTYRAAQGAFFGALACAGVEALPWGVLKGLWLRHLRWWMRQPAFSASGVLAVGYRYPNAMMAEAYNGPGASYWAMKAFAPLALPPSHPFWQADAAPLPARRRVHTVPQAGLVLCSAPGATDVVALNAGQPVRTWPRHAAHKYSKFAYSTRFGFTVPVGLPTLEEGGFDSVLALSDDDGRLYRARDHARDARVDGGVAYSAWDPWPDVTVETWLVAAGTAFVRVHRIASRRALVAADTGFACGYERVDTVSGNSSRPGQAYVISPHGFSSLRDITGTRTAAIIKLDPASHVLQPLAAMPVLLSRHAAGERWLACVAWGAAQPIEQPRWAVTQSPRGGFVVMRGSVAWCECNGADVVKAVDADAPG